MINVKIITRKTLTSGNATWTSMRPIILDKLFLMTHILVNEHMWRNKHNRVYLFYCVTFENRNLCIIMSGSLTHWWSGTKQAFKLLGQFCMFFVPCSCSCPCSKDDEEQERLMKKAKRKRNRWNDPFRVIEKTKNDIYYPISSNHSTYSKSHFNLRI